MPYSWADRPVTLLDLYPDKIGELIAAGLTDCPTLADEAKSWEAEMPLTAKGKKIKAAMQREYGTKKGERVFYASINKGKVKGAERRGARRGR